MLMNNFPLSLGAGLGKYFQHWPGYHSDLISGMFQETGNNDILTMEWHAGEQVEMSINWFE